MTLPAPRSHNRRGQPPVGLTERRALFGHGTPLRYLIGRRLTGTRRSPDRVRGFLHEDPLMARNTAQLRGFHILRYYRVPWRRRPRTCDPRPQADKPLTIRRFLNEYPVMGMALSRTPSPAGDETSPVSGAERMTTPRSSLARMGQMSGSGVIPMMQLEPHLEAYPRKRHAQVVRLVCAACGGGEVEAPRG